MTTTPTMSSTTLQRLFAIAVAVGCTALLLLATLRFNAGALAWFETLSEAQRYWLPRLLVSVAMFAPALAAWARARQLPHKGQQPS